jgi:archaellum component FlaF (FlaF/FlaG flagellin family)
MNLNTSPFNIGFGVVVTGTVNYTVQHTFDDVNLTTFNPSTAVWFDHPTIAGLAVNADGNYAFPVTAIRLLVNSGGGTARLTLLQAGIQ